MKKGILIIGHGSRYNYNKWIMEEQKKRLEQKGFGNVYIGFNETTFPLVNDALEDMVSDGVEEIVAVPFFIASGLHIARDIPNKLGIPPCADTYVAEIKGKKISIRYERPFGSDPMLAAILSERIEELSNGGKNRWIMVIGHGSRLPHNKETVLFQADLLRRKGYDNVRCAFNEFDEPFVEDVFKEMVSGGADEIIVLPLFISLGAHLKHDIPRKIHIRDGMAGEVFVHGGRNVTVRYAAPIGSDPRLTDIIAEKIRGRG
ncbi:MAG: sirohydrochlorin cobaltochelatase [Methanomassiliicoccaceae archaeon]|nr:sirohydrochlorin cobaltochelatase [Methanomassiliicoccaceae archaeon]MCL2145779.1 sirohydrochlorin cobaltochelatase [Methanomassiliicoccaceae archaeon]